MNSTEEQLRAAMSAVGDTLGQEDIRPLARPAGRRSHPSRRAALIATAASVAAVVIGVSIATGSGGSGGPRPALGSSPSARTTPDGAPPKADVLIMLCGRTSANPTCDRTAVTRAQVDGIKNDLMDMPAVRKVEFVSSREAHEGLLNGPARDDPVVVGGRPEDVAAMFRVDLRDPDDRRIVMNAFLGRPGVDLVVTGDGTALPPR
ncbi:permease-like cell division protein FtsX [Actinomadura alba]|uniref:FtsX extracellular domain-containing protein n=1 Tax=Actinomadura alba TaxID=406431 RepID=A0ABR7M2U6_9ACTN|nr:permease-like cell division protein FtsX [Actinomadura alba]MBC6471040.1 hypothetical protein [Actinomadura alba]